MKALVLGGSGAVGRELVNRLLGDPNFEEVHLFLRRPMQVRHDKLHIHIVNFDDSSTWAPLVKGDVLFSALGTSIKQAGSKEAQWKVDYEYQYAFAKLAKEQGIKKYILVSSIGANPKSKYFYLQMKGLLDEAIQGLEFPSTAILRPSSLIRPIAKRPSEHWAVMGLKCLNALGFLKRYKPIHVAQVAQAMVALSLQQDAGFTVLENEDIFRFLRK